MSNPHVTYRCAIESAAERGGLDRLPAAQREGFDVARQLFELDAATIERDIALWQEHLAAVAALARARDAIGSHRSDTEIEADIERAKEQLRAAMAEPVARIRELVGEKHGRKAATARIAAAESRATLPADLSWAFHGLPAPERSIGAGRLTMLGAPGSETMR